MSSEDWTWLGTLVKVYIIQQVEHLKDELAKEKKKVNHICMCTWAIVWDIVMFTTGWWLGTRETKGLWNFTVSKISMHINSTWKNCKYWGPENGGSLVAWGFVPIRLVPPAMYQILWSSYMTGETSLVGPAMPWPDQLSLNYCSVPFCQIPGNLGRVDGSWASPCSQ